MESFPTLPTTNRLSEGAGTCHVLRRGQTLFSIARAYGVPLEALVELNQISDPARVQAGLVLFVPGASAPIDVPPSMPAAALLSWPLEGSLTSYFGSQRGRQDHEGIDIDGEVGQVVLAAAAGRVIWAGEERGYGNVVIINHGGGLSTLYAHASRLLVGPDQSVETGDPVAEVGDTGNARGAHLHFEVHRNGQPVNPLPMLGAPLAKATGQR
ncbi:MAG TPA: LysM peptidoglycan-binding domain-containing M23 family metallopeptidase [Candidatus Polarisedimenticolia bacterium]|nr:LysM peptidoglycan-binding domain-containing M23 family metallopeptidase [Candidatus Polarisedimenticolia bacterium]